MQAGREGGSGLLGIERHDSGAIILEGCTRRDHLHLKPSATRRPAGLQLPSRGAAKWIFFNGSLKARWQHQGSHQLQLRKEGRG